MVPRNMIREGFQEEMLTTTPPQGRNPSSQVQERCKGFPEEAETKWGGAQCTGRLKETTY